MPEHYIDKDKSLLTEIKTLLWAALIFPLLLLWWACEKWHIKFHKRKVLKDE
jgi:hypothetical protein